MHLILDFTRDCNSRCSTCHIWKTRGPTLPLEVIFKAIRGLPLTSVFVTGGEPYIKGEVSTIARWLSLYRPGCTWEAATNCISPLTETRIGIVAGYLPTTTCLSLEGDEDTHDAVRGVKGSYKRVMEVRAFLESKGLPYYFNAVTEEGLAEGERLGVVTSHKLRRYGKRFGGIRGENPSQVIAGCKGGTDALVLDPEGKLWACEEYRPELFISDLFSGSVDYDRLDKVGESVRMGACGPCSMSCWYH